MPDIQGPLAPLLAIIVVSIIVVTLAVVFFRKRGSRIRESDPSQTVRLQRDWVDYTVASMAVLGVAAGSLAFTVAYLEYDHLRHNSRVVESLNYVARFKSSPLLDSTKKIGALLNTDEAKTILSGWKDKADWERQAIQFDKSHNLEFDVRLIADFFDELYVCVSHTICDEDLATGLLGFDLRNLYVWNAPLLRQIRESGEYGPGFSCGFKTLAAAVSSSRAQLSRTACPDLMKHASSIRL